MNKKVYTIEIFLHRTFLVQSDEQAKLFQGIDFRCFDNKLESVVFFFP